MYKRQPKSESLKKLYFVALQAYRKDPVSTAEITGCDPRHESPETAALVLVASAIFNLDEFVVKN